MRKLRSVLLVIAAWAVCSTAALAWTGFTTVSDTSAIASNSRVARGRSGGMHIIYYRTEPEWRICYRYRTSCGYLSPIETLSNTFSYRPDVIEDAQGRPHVLYPGTSSNGSADMFHTYKDNGVWISEQITDTAGVEEDEPKMALDSSGKIHAVYTRGTAVVYRTLTSGTWSAEYQIGVCSNSYYHRPDISIDPAGGIHTVWADDLHAYYRKCTTGSWGPTKTIVTSTNYIAFPKVAAPSINQVVVITFDQDSGGYLRYTCSNDGGNGWQAAQWMTKGHWPNLDTDGQGNVYAGFTNTGAGNAAGYMKWNGAAWTNVVNVAPSGKWQGWVDIACGIDGTVTMTWDDNVYSKTCINLSSSAAPPPDTTVPSAPSRVTDDGATQGFSTYLHAIWGAADDPESFIDHYEYSIGNSAGSTNVVPWTSAGQSFEVTKSGTFMAGTYFFNVRAVNGAGLAGPAASSDGVKITAGANPFSFAAPMVVSSSSYTCDNAMIARAGDGGVHLVFRDDNASSSRVIYRKKAADGLWGNAETASASVLYAGYSDVLEDSVGNIHVIYTNSMGREGMDVFHRTKTGTTWNAAVNVSNNNTMCWYPRVAASGTTVHLVENYGTDQNNLTSKTANKTASANWSTFSSLGASKRYGNPDIVRSSDGVLHAVWMQTDVLKYSKNTGSGWSAPVDVASAPGVPMPRINCDSNSRPVIVWLGSPAVNNWYPINFTRWNGSAWTAVEVIAQGHYPVVAGDAFGNVHVAYVGAGVGGKEDIMHLVNNGSGWSVPVNISSSAGVSIRPALEVDNAGAVNIAWQDNTSGLNQIMFSSAPSVVVSGTITGYVRDTQNKPLSGAVVSTSTGGYSTTTVGDGSYTLSNVMPETYTVMASRTGFDPKSVPSVVVVSGQTASADFTLVPVLKTISQAKSLADWTPVTVSEGVVTGVFNGFFYVQTPDRRMGIKVESAFSVNVGDPVVVSGCMVTVSGERCITQAVVSLKQ